MYVGAESDDC